MTYWCIQVIKQSYNAVNKDNHRGSDLADGDGRLTQTRLGRPKIMEEVPFKLSPVREVRTGLSDKQVEKERSEAYSGNGK